MSIYLILFEAIPLPSNPESNECAGAYVNCSVNSNDKKSARSIATEYVYEQGWKVKKVEDEFISSREMYDDEPDSLECYNQAIENGIGAIFYTWPHKRKTLKKIIPIVLAAVVVLFLLTNPSKAYYAQWQYNKVLKFNQSLQHGGLCEHLPSYYETTTNRFNYYLFSIYTNRNGGNFFCVGILHSFIQHTD